MKCTVTSLTTETSAPVGRYTVAIAGITKVTSPVIEGTGKIETRVEMDCEMADDNSIELSIFGADKVQLAGPMKVDLSGVGAAPMEKRIKLGAGKKAISLTLSTMVASRMSYDAFLEKGLDYVKTAEKPWYFKGQDLYSVAKAVAGSVGTKVPPKVGDVMVKATHVLDQATLSVLKRFTSMSIEDNFSVLEKLDELLALTAVKGDELVDDSRDQLVVSVRALKEAVMAQTERLVNASTNNMSKMLQKWQVLKLTATERLNTVQDDVRTQASTLLKDTRSKLSTEADRIIAQAEPVMKRAIAATHPYVQSVYGASQPYINDAMTVSEPFVQQAQPLVAPYLAKAMEFIEGNKLATEIITQGNVALSNGRAYYENVVASSTAPVDSAATVPVPTATTDGASSEE